MKYYCMKCGYGNSYASLKPSKCSSCGESLNEVVVATQPKPRVSPHTLIRKPTTPLKHQETPNLEDYVDFDPGFSNSLLEELEPLSANELEMFLAKGSNRGVKLTDAAPNLKSSIEVGEGTKVKTPKRRGRPRKQ